MVTPEKNGVIQWGYGLSTAEWQKAGNGDTTISKLNMGETGNEKHEEGNVVSGGTNTMAKVTKPTAIEIFRKLNWLPVGSMIGMHQVDHLEEQEKDQVLLSLVVNKGAKKFSKSSEMLAKKWTWYSREALIEMFNNETDMGEAIFKATYLEDEVKIPDITKIAPANIIPLVGIDWPKRVHSGKGLQVEVIGMIAKVMWRAFPKQAVITLELLKKEDMESLLRILTQQGELHEWAKRQGIKLEYEEIKIIQKETIESDE